jgi:hypothetical protein
VYVSASSRLVYGVVAAALAGSVSCIPRLYEQFVGKAREELIGKGLTYCYKS